MDEIAAASLKCASVPACLGALGMPSCQNMRRNPYLQLEYTCAAPQISAFWTNR